MDKSIIDGLLEKAYAYKKIDGKDVQQVDEKGKNPHSAVFTPKKKDPNSPVNAFSTRDYKYSPKKQEMTVEDIKNPKGEYKKIPTTAAHEKELKNASKESDMEKCHTHVLDGETEDSLKAKKKQAPKADGHVLGADPKDKRGSEYEMVEAWAPGVGKSISSGFEPSDLVKSISVLLEKAVYGAGASGGKFQRGSGKDESKPGAVKKPELTEEQKKKYISGAQTKASHLASSSGMHGLAAKIKAEKSLDERTTDLVKALNVDYGPRKSGVKRGGYKQDPDYDLHPKDREKSDSNSDTRGPLPSDADSSKKSLDERTCNLVKDMSQQREREIHDAVSTVRMVKEDVPEASKMDVNPEDVHRAYSLHSNLTKPQTQKSICDKWQTGSAFMTKGARVMPLGPGGEVSTLAKDDADRQAAPRGRTPSYHQTDTKQFDVESGKLERERKAKKRVAALKEEQDFGAE